MPPPVPPVAAVPPLVPEEADDEPPALAPDDAAVDGELPLEDEVDVVVEVVEVVEVCVVPAGAAVIAAVGTVSCGAPAVSVVAEPPPHAASATLTPTPAANVPISPRGPLGANRRRVTA